MHYVILYGVTGVALFFWIVVPVIIGAPGKEDLIEVKGLAHKIDKDCNSYRGRAQCIYILSVLTKHKTIEFNFGREHPRVKKNDLVTILTTESPLLWSERYKAYDLKIGSKHILRFSDDEKLRLFTETFLKIVFCFVVVGCVSGIARFNEQENNKNSDSDKAQI